MHNRATSKKSYQYAALCGLAMGMALGTSIAIIQRMAMHHRMPNLKAWQKALIAKHGEVQGASLAARIQARYDMQMPSQPFAGSVRKCWDAAMTAVTFDGAEVNRSRQPQD